MKDGSNHRRAAEPLQALRPDDTQADEQDDLPNTPRGSRKRARMACVQALYQWLLAGTEIGDLITQFARSGRLARADRDYFETLLGGVTGDHQALEAAFDPHLSRPAVQLDPVERAILLMGVFELRDRVEIPFAAVINEACDMARIYGAQDGHRFVNGVLDATARTLRADETRARR